MKTKECPISREARRHLIIAELGTAEAQKDALVAEILETFSDPEKWPIDDHSRIELIKRLFVMAKRIQTTTNA